MKGGQKNCYEHETTTTHDTPQEGRNNRRTLLITGGKLGCRPTVAKMLMFSVPPGYRRSRPPARPKLDPFVGIIERILEEDKGQPAKQQHTSKRIFERLRDEHGYNGGITIVRATCTSSASGCARCSCRHATILDTRKSISAKRSR